jgi:glycosyltransferase involved in cell wall biosynthesis
MERGVSVIILTKNEQKHIRRCLESLLSFTNQIFIVDSFSSDSTIEIAESLGVKIYKNKWVNYAKQFQWGLDNCPIKTDWVMRMDADEYVTSKLAIEIQDKLKTIDNKISGLYIKRRVHFKNKWIRFGGKYPEWLLRVWRHKEGFIEERWMDEHIVLKKGETEKLKFDLVDENLNNISWWTEKHNNYATREAIDLLNLRYNFYPNSELKASLFGEQEQRKRYLKNVYAKIPLFVRPFIYFSWRYFFKFGFLDGKQGLIWHFLQGFWYRFLVDTKVYEIENKSKKNGVPIVRVLEEDYGYKKQKQ